MNQLDLLMIMVSVLVAVWLFLIVVSQFWYRRGCGLPLLRRAYMNAIPYSEREAAWAAADMRRQAIIGFFAEERERNAANEFLELPPAFPGLERPRETDDDNAKWNIAWRTARLRIQLDRDEHLLVERFVDALVYLNRAGRMKAPDFPICIRLERLPRFRGPNKFPWRVVVVTESPFNLLDWLSRRGAKEWFGIGVDVVRPVSAIHWNNFFAFRRYGNELLAFLTKRTRAATPKADEDDIDFSGGASVTPQGRCVMGDDGRTGQIGGILDNGSDDRLGVTCRHVLSGHCGSVRWPSPVRPANYVFAQDSPDVALLSTESGCFVDERTHFDPAICATNAADLELAITNGTLLVKAPKNDRKKGVVKAAQVSGFKLGEYFYRGIHFEITPCFYELLWVKWPLFARRFSAEGDSGSWVMDDQLRTWFGVVVGGYSSPNTMTVALASYYLMDAYRELKNQHSRIPPRILSSR